MAASITLPSKTTYLTRYGRCSPDHPGQESFWLLFYHSPSGVRFSLTLNRGDISSSGIARTREFEKEWLELLSQQGLNAGEGGKEIVGKNGRRRGKAWVVRWEELCEWILEGVEGGLGGLIGRSAGFRGREGDGMTEGEDQAGLQKVVGDEVLEGWFWDVCWEVRVVVAASADDNDKECGSQGVKLVVDKGPEIKVSLDHWPVRAEYALSAHTAKMQFHSATVACNLSAWASRIVTVCEVEEEEEEQP